MIVKKVENTKNVEDLSIILILEAEKKALIPCKTNSTAKRLEVQLFQPELQENKNNLEKLQCSLFPPFF